MRIKPFGSWMLGALGALGAALIIAPADRCQSAQPYSVQASLFIADLGTGVEMQARYSPSAFSIGVGYQATISTSISLGDFVKSTSGYFLEPRYAVDIKSDKYAPYISGRVAVLHQDGGSGTQYTEFGAGAGLLVRVTPTVNLDFALAGLGEVGTGNGFGIIAKAGFSFGFGAH
jgi:hypothetical protein